MGTPEEEKSQKEGEQAPVAVADGETQEKAGEVVVAQEATDAGTTGTEEVVAGEAVAQEIASAVAVATGEAVAAVAEEAAAQETADADKGEQAPPQMQALQLRRSRIGQQRILFCDSGGALIVLFYNFSPSKSSPRLKSISFLSPFAGDFPFPFPPCCSKCPVGLHSPPRFNSLSTVPAP